MDSLSGKISVSRYKKVKNNHKRSSSIDISERDSKEGEQRTSVLGISQNYFKKSIDTKNTDLKKINESKKTSSNYYSVQPRY